MYGTAVLAPQLRARGDLAKAHAAWAARDPGADWHLAQHQGACLLTRTSYTGEEPVTTQAGAHPRRLPA